VAPIEWQSWVALGNSYVAKAYQVIRKAGMQSPSKEEELEKSGPAYLIRGLGNLAFYPESPQATSRPEFAEAQNYFDKAAPCFDRAVNVADKEPQVYMKRAKFHFSRASVKILQDGGGAREAMSR